MKYPSVARLEQVHLKPFPDGYETVSSYKGGKHIYTQEHETLQADLLRLCSKDLWFQGSHQQSCPRPILVTEEHQEQLAQLHYALATAIADIVSRWWTDSNADFPSRMPLERPEEELLQWLETQRSPSDPPFSECLGSWRPDFLVEEAAERKLENYRLTEINARFCFNGFMHQAYGQEALSALGVGTNGTVHATDSVKILNGLLNLFNPERPLHLLKGTEPGIDIHMFVDFVHRYIGIRPRLITPEDLRLISDCKSKGGYKLCCLMRDDGVHTPGASIFYTGDGEAVEEIQQVGLELHQRELFGLSKEMLHQVSLRCFNDMRTILLVHDKRMLGIIKQEIPTLVSRKVLTPAQGQALEKGIADTILPGSIEMEELIQLSTDAPERRKEYLLKPIRGGKGAGIVFGDDVDPAQWLSILERLRTPHLISGATTYVAQRRIWPCLYDVVLGTSGNKARYPLIGTYHSSHGKLLGLGTWRSSPHRICAVSHGGGWICSILRKD